MALLLVGCSGATNTELFEGTSDRSDIAAAEPAAAPSSPSSPSPSSPASTAPTNVPDQDAGIPLPASGDAGSVAVPPPPSCTPEVEPNNDATHATPFARSLCGAIASSGDVDFGAFVAPAGARKLKVDLVVSGGSVSYRYYGPGGPTQGDSSDAVPGTVYLVRLVPGQGNGTAKPTYQFNVTFE